MSLLFRKKNIYPIILPQKFYVDRYHNSNAYIEMNPSMYIDASGNIKILVRCINYRKYLNKSFTMFENYSNSLYAILYGKIEEGWNLDIDNFGVYNIEYKYDLPVYPSYWKGLEDIRFIDEETLLVTIPECNPCGNPSVFRAKTENNRIHSFTHCRPNTIEKNWMPYKSIDGKEMVIYSLSPFTIKEVEGDVFEKLWFLEEIHELLEGCNGSTNGILYDETNEIYLFLIHKNKERVYHRWLLFNIVKNEIKVSFEFTFFRYSYIEFPVSLAKWGERVFISIGVNDDKAFILETEMNSIRDVFTITS